MKKSKYKNIFYLSSKIALQQWHSFSNPPPRRQTGQMTLTVPGQQSHHSSEDADEVEHGVYHLVLEDPVWVGRSVAGDANGGVGERHNEVDCHAAQHDDPVNHRLSHRETQQRLDK